MEIGRPNKGLILDSVPDGVETGLSNLVQKWPSQDRRSATRFVYENLDIKYEEGATPTWDYMPTFRDFLRYQLIPQGWHLFYDLIEILWEFLDERDRVGFQIEVNSILRRNYVGYELRKGKLERVGASEADAAIAEARGVLRDGRFKGPNEQFLKALDFYSQRPEPDEENCVKEAVGAVEGVARILLGSGSILLSDAAKELVKRKKLHPTLQKVIDGIYAYRGDADGVGHGLTGEPQVTVHDAEFVLNTSAALIVYLARLYGVEVVT
jgi:hypothetical protein